MRGVSVPLSSAPHPHRSEGSGAGGSAREPLEFGGRPNASQPPQSQARSMQCRGRGRISIFLAFTPNLLPTALAVLAPGSLSFFFTFSLNLLGCHWLIKSHRFL